MKENRAPPLDALNGDSKIARQHLIRCCGSTRWVEAMLGRRPFESSQRVLDCASDSWRSLRPEDWLEAFSHHPRIGEAPARRSLDGTERDWAEKEQSGATAADSSIRAALDEGNRQYEARFGYLFIVCATGKSGEEMLSLLRTRLKNAPEVELAIAAGEQEKITRIRLEKLLSP
jgi:2-oxo-4-hydroxy-4-carboxy-5-ureidoimidazoline decarboxylase